MKISDYAVKNPQISSLMILMLAVLGITTLLNIPRSEDPEINAPQFPIVILYPGTSPKDMEDLVVNKIENKISSLENIKRIRSHIGDGFAVINVDYKYNSNVDDKYQELIREVNSMRGELPKEIYSINISKITPSNVNILQMSLVSENASLDSLKYYAEKLKDELEKLPALKNIEISGLPDRNVRIELHLDKMSQLRIPLNAVMESIQGESANIPGGSIDAGTKTFNIETSGNYKTIEDVQNTVVYSINEKNILLKDIADVFFDFEKSKHITRLNGHRAIYIVGAQKPGENITKTQKTYLPVLEKFKKTLPPNIDFVDQFDQADNVNHRLIGLGRDFLIAILLVSITLLPLGSRAALIVMVSIPLSLAIGLVLLSLLGFNLNQLSIVGLVVALGLLVDDSIVVVENIERWLREGHSRLNAVLMATQQIGFAVMGTTATLIIAFLPLVFLPEASGDFIRSLPMAVIASVLASMIVSLTFIPFFSNNLLKAKGGHSEGNIFLRGLQKVIHGTYSVLLEKALKRPAITIGVTLVIFIGSLFLFKVIGFSLFPASEKPQFLIDITTPLQSNLDYTDQITKQVEQELKNIKEVKYFSTNVGKGNPRIYYNVIPEHERSDYAQIFVQLQPNTDEVKKMQIIDNLRKKWTPYPGAKVEVKNFEQGPPVTAPVEIRISGDNLDTLRAKATEVENMLKGIKGTIYINNPLSTLKSDIKVDIDKAKSNMLGISTINIDRIIRLAVVGLEAGQLTDYNGKNYNLVVTKSKDNITSLDAFKNLYFNNKKGNVIPLSQIAKLTFESSPVTINHRNKIRTVTISSFVRKGFLANDISNETVEKLKTIPLPPGYEFEMGGEVEQRSESFGGFGTIVIVTVFLFLTVLLLEFKTFKSTFIVLSVIPLGIVGAVIALFLTGNTLSFVAVIGLIALAGIEVKNTILLVDFINQLRAKGYALDDAIREAGEVRFLPIVLTTLTAIGGLIPIAISTNPLISPLAIVIIGGLISSTLLSRVVTPVIYKLFPPNVEIIGS